MIKAKIRKTGPLEVIYFFNKLQTGFSSNNFQKQLISDQSSETWLAFSAGPAE